MKKLVSCLTAFAVSALMAGFTSILFYAIAIVAGEVFTGVAPVVIALLCAIVWVLGSSAVGHMVGMLVYNKLN